MSAALSARTSAFAGGATSVRVSRGASARTIGAARGPLRVRAYEQEFCQDKVNIRKEGDGKGKINKVTFLGANGSAQVVEVPEDTYLLDAAERANIELPATCRGGICGTCVGRVAKGEVDQSDISDLTFVLEPEEIEKGMALLCMSRAVGDVEIETQCDWGYLLGIEEWKGATGQTGKPQPLMGTEWDEKKEA